MIVTGAVEIYLEASSQEEADQIASFFEASDGVMGCEIEVKQFKVLRNAVQISLDLNQELLDALMKMLTVVPDQLSGEKDEVDWGTNYEDFESR